MRGNILHNKWFTKIMTLLTTLMVTVGLLLPNVTVVNAASTLQIAQYISNTGTVSGVTGSNNGTYNGTWTADVPIADVMSELAPYMTTYGNLYPWNIDGTSGKVASIKYSVTFPTEATVGTPTTASTSAIIPGTTITYTVSGNVVTFDLPLAQQNWAGINTLYQSDVAAGTQNRKVTLTIPYSINANGYVAANAIDQNLKITSTGSFGFITGRSFFRIPTEFQADTATISLTNSFATSNVFEQPTVTNSNVTVDVDADLLIDNNTANNAVTKQKTDDLNFVGLFHAKTIKDQMAAIEASYAAAANQISLANLNTSFTATITLPTGLSFTDIPSLANTTLEGANGSFVISNVTGNMQSATVTFELVNAANITNFTDLKNAVNAVADDMKIKVPVANFDARSVGGGNYEVIGTVNGNLTATATNNVSGSTINFDLKWVGKQMAAGASVNNPSAIALTVNYPAPLERSYEEVMTLPGDILVGNETQHNAVYETTRDANLAFTGSLDVSSVKTKMSEIENAFNRANVDPTTIALTDYSATFTASLTLPSEMNFDTNPTVSLLHDNGKYRIISQTIYGNTIAVTMTVAAPVTTFAELKDAVLGMENTMEVVVDGVHFNSTARPNTNYTVAGSMMGLLMAKATDGATGNVVTFALKWDAVQLPSGADATNPTSNEITFTLKYLAAPETVKPATPKTGDNSQLPIYVGAVIIALAGFGFAVVKRFKFNKQ